MNSYVRHVLLLIVLAAFLTVSLTSCASTLALATDDVRYIDTSELDSTATRSDDNDQDVARGLDNTIPNEGEYDVALWVMNVSGGSTTFTLSLKDDQTTREIWRNERLSKSIDFTKETEQEAWWEGTRMCVARVKGDSATLIVNGKEHSIEPTGRARVDTWAIAIFKDRVVIELFEMH